MATEKTSLKIKTKVLGEIQDVINFLTDLKNAYNSIYTYDFIVESCISENRRRAKNFQEKIDAHFEKSRYSSYSYQFVNFSDIDIPKSLLEIQNKVDINRVILPGDQLYISRINIQSPGFWEVIGSLNPINQIREYINDRHERKKDVEFRNRQEEEMTRLEIVTKENGVIQQRIEILKSIGYSELEIRQMLTSLVLEPLSKIGKHQDLGQIENAE